MTLLQEKLIHTLEDLLGTACDTDDAYDGRLTAHAALTVAAGCWNPSACPPPSRQRRFVD